MSAIDFPNSPSVNDTHTVGDRSWKWNGSQWKVVRSVLPGPTGPTGPTGPAGGGRTLIESKSLTGASVEFTSISNQYTDLYLVVEGATADFDETNVDVRVNNNSSAIYVRGKNEYTESYIFFCSTDSTESLANIRFLDYNSSNYKFAEYTSITLNVEPETPREYFIDGLSSYAIMATAAITSIQIFAGETYDYDLGELVDEGAVFTGGTAYLYGVSL